MTAVHALEERLRAALDEADAPEARRHLRDALQLVDAVEREGDRTRRRV